MSDIRTSITLVDNLSAPARGMAAAMSATVSECEKMKRTIGSAPDMSGYKAAGEQFKAMSDAERQAAEAAAELKTSQTAVAAGAHATANALEDQADRLRKSAQAAQAKADAEQKAVTIYEQEYRAYEKNANELGVLTEAQKKSIDRYREAYEEKKKVAEGAQNLADRLKLESEMADKAAQSARKEADAYGEVNTVTEKMGGSFGMAADSMSNLMMAAGGYKVMQLVRSAFEEATAAAIEYQSAMTGIYKTVDGTSAQLAKLGSDTRSMALDMPSTTTEIAGVMESAGQLGIATDNVTDFAKTMIDLGNATNLTADQAASSLAKFANITGMSADNYRNLGSVIVDLGNNFATTEADIVNMSTYLTSAASVAGFAETDILALSAAMSSVGINAEAGGSSMSKLISEMQTAVEVGGEGLTAFADVAGMSAQQFSTEWGTNAVGALQAFIVGLNDVERNGKSMSVILQDLDLDDIRMSNMLKALAQGSDVMTSAVSRANTAWKENTALTNEVEKRYATLESKMTMMGNAANDLKISVGNSLTPAMGLAADAATSLMKGLSSAADTCPTFTGGVMGAVGAIGGLGSAAMTALPLLAQLSQAMQGFRAAKEAGSLPGFLSSLTMGKIGLIIGGIAAAGAAIGALSGAFSKAEKEVDDYNGTLEDCAREIENTKLVHDKAIGSYGEQSAAAQELQGQLELLNAQYEKGGGVAADYAARIEETSKAFQQLSDDYNDKIRDIETSQTFAQTAVSQLEALQDKANKTNPDLELMGKYADYLNDTFHCNIVVDYNTGEITGFDPVEVGTKKAREIAEKNKKQAAFDSVTSNDFQQTYNDSLKQAQEMKKIAENPIKELNKLIDEFDPSHFSQMYDESGNLLNKYRSKFDFEKFDYRALYEGLENPGYTGDKLEKFLELQNALDRYANGEDSIIADYENAMSKYHSQRDFAKKAFEDSGAPGQEISYLAGITPNSNAKHTVNSFHDYKTYMDEFKSSAADTESVLDAFGQKWHDVMSDGGLTAQETADIINAMPTELQGSMASYIDEISKIGEEYSTVYQNIKSNVDGMFGLMDEAKINSEATTLKITENYGTQYDYWKKANEGIDFLAGLTAESLKVSEDELKQYGLGIEYLKEQAQTGSADIIGLALDMKNDVKNKNTELVRDTILSIGKVQEEKEKFEGNTAEWVTEAEKKAQDVYDKYHEAVSKMEHLETPMRSAAFSIMNAYAQGITAHSGMAIAAAQNVANQIQSILSTPSISVGASTISSVMSTVTKRGFATGTLNAPPGLALVGENGPELVNFGGGEVVYTAAQTQRMMQDMGNMTDVYIPQNINEVMGMREPSYNGSWSDSTGEGSRDRTITINIGSDTIRVQGNISRDDVCDLLVSNLKPALMGIISEEIFEEGEGSYEY